MKQQLTYHTHTHIVMKNNCTFVTRDYMYHMTLGRNYKSEQYPHSILVSLSNLRWYPITGFYAISLNHWSKGYIYTIGMYPFGTPNAWLTF